MKYPKVSLLQTETNNTYKTSSKLISSKQPLMAIVSKQTAIRGGDLCPREVTIWNSNFKKHITEMC